MSSDSTLAEARTTAAKILHAAWDESRGYSWPNEHVYPHLWLWDSCFHSIAWAALGDERAVRELEAVFVAQLPGGFVPHMRYATPSEHRGPLEEASGYTQPPVYGHALATLSRQGLAVPDPLLARVAAAYEYLWLERRTVGGLLEIVHPWEAGADDSPRWDAWVGSTEWDRARWTVFDLELVEETMFATTGEATSNARFEAAPAAFNAIAAHGMRELASVGGDPVWSERADELSAAIDEQLWDTAQQLWSDIAVVGPGASTAVPTLDGVLPALATRNPDLAAKALDQLEDDTRFAAPFGLAYVARDHPLYRPDLYWRGAAWPPLNHLARVAAVRWGRMDLADEIALMTRRGVISSGFAELWHPETGEARGAVPQTWAALAAVDSVDQPPISE
ncbi:MAG: trehalase family glycosidase [Acidimicrobiia bacterium]|nr:MAG: trehalase family glycosidase [Acidimicrobiia bacterium]